MGVKERKLRQKKFLRQEILDAASELFVKEGFENVSMRRIAEKIEYSPTTIYLYFKDKAELLEQVCHETFARLTAHLTRILEQPGDPAEQIEYSPTTIYLYFKDKAELLEQVCHETFARLTAHLTRILEQPGDPAE